MENNTNNFNENNNYSKFASCLVCCNNIIKTQFCLPCQCDICEDCVFEWIAAKNYEMLFSKYESYTCPSHTCKQIISFDWLMQNLSRKNVNCINEILLRKYFNSNQSIRKCPNQLCTYTGWVDTTKKCSNNIECELCEENWLDPSLMSYKLFYQIYLYFFNFKENILSDLTQLNILITSKPCANCDIQIYKYSGCDHVICANCKKDFCYNCMRTHQNNVITEASCAFKYFISILVVLLLLISFLVKFCFSFHIISKTIVFIINCICINALFGIYGYFVCAMFYFAAYSIIVNNDYGKPPFIIQGLCGIIFAACVLSHIYMYVYNYVSVIYLTNYMLIELCLAGIIFILGYLIGYKLIYCYILRKDQYYYRPAVRY